MSAKPPALPALDEIVETFEFLEGWDDRYQYIIDLGRTLPPMPDDEVCDANRVHGCQAHVWLTMQPEDGNRLRIHATSDAHIVSGLIAILLALYDDKTADEILAADVEGVIGKLDLAAHLSPTRKNGLFSMIGRIRERARELNA